ncbi:MAG: redoxin family protein [Clostridia bacterium]|nr:redoxin family protein [Clostridia bacterium]
MDKQKTMTARLRDHLPTRRRVIQLYCALLYNANLKGFIRGDIYTGPLKNLCVPGLNCYSCPGAIAACPLGALQNALASSGNRTPVYVLGILMLFGLMLGRTVCGFLCPAGLLQELLYKIPTPKVRKGVVTRALSYLKYVILFVFVVILPVGYAFRQVPLPAFCKYICPVGTLEGAIGLLSNPVNADKYGMLGLLFTRKYVILMAVAALCVFVYRAFCRFLCPLGAIYGLFSKVALLGVKVEMPKCIGCGKCTSVCKMDIRHVGDHECIHCGECIAACPAGAISLKCGKITLMDKTQAVPKSKTHSTARIIAAVAAVLALVSVLWLVNTDRAEDAPLPEAAVEETLPVGFEEGMRAPDFSVPVYGQEEAFTLSEHLGQVVVVNFWATWCGPCVVEIPYFDEVYRNYGGEIAVVAVHSDLVTDDVEAYLSGYDYAMPFALDADGSVIASFGGSAMLPQTAVIGKDGTIIYNAVGSMTRETLRQLLKKAGADV